MNPVILYTTFFLTIILVIAILTSEKKSYGIKILTYFGIGIGLLVVGINSLFDNSAGASTPIQVRTENLTENKIKIYAIVFWSKSWNGHTSYVTFDKELEPNHLSEFRFEFENAIKFWIVAENANGDIEYLTEINEDNADFEFKITDNQDINAEKANVAKELISKSNSSRQEEKYLIWINFILIGLLIWSLIKRKTGGNRVDGSAIR